MSADDMLAAQLWPWPDPIIKRNTQGGVIFVNAAFLQIYGGQVTDWHGCAVEGWPVPMTGHVPNRFETRIMGEAGEMIYDWLEYTMPDGGALAMSRNVTSLLAVTPPTDPAMAPMPHIDPMSVEAHMQAPVAPSVHTEPNGPAAIVQEVYEAPEMPVTETVPLPIHTSDASTEVMTNAEPALDTAHMIAETNAADQDMPIEQVPEMEEPSDERDFERRALPIENEESLLGANWRDAVIAKAVGADGQPDSPDVVEDSAAPESLDESPIVAPESSLVASPNDNDGAIRILLAEDNAINALLTRTLLEADGCHVEVVEDGSLAVDAVRANSYDMILMDMRMPNMDGLEATRKIRSLSNEAKSIPIIALTANAFDDDRNACFDAGMNDFMTKPVSAEELQQMVQTWTKSATSQAA